MGTAGRKPVRQDFKGRGKEYEFCSKHDGKSLDRVEPGNNRV